MANPHPTKSKPCKIGRKHTKAKSSRQREKDIARKRKANRIKIGKLQKRKELVAKFWRGELDQHPE